MAAHRRDDGVEIAVQDQGPVFRPRSPTGSSTRFHHQAEGEGTGLGLSISIGIVEQHGGRLTLENGPGGGFWRAWYCH